MSGTSLLIVLGQYCLEAGIIPSVCHALWEQFELPVIQSRGVYDL